MPNLVRSNCPKCGKKLKVDDSLMGRNVRCPTCEHRFLLSSISLTDDGSPAVSIDAKTDSQDESSRSGDSSRTRYRSDSEATIGRIGRFELKAVVGHGAFGRVYRAYDPQLDRQVALKVPKFANEETKKFRRFLAEAKAAAALRHPNIVAVFESGRADGEYFIASEFVAGQTLAEQVRKTPPKVREAAAWIRDLAQALFYAHEEGIVHRDIKPENIMISANGRPQIMDFGLAKRLDEDSSMTAEGGVLGTPAYMSPEQARGETDRVGPASDQYSLGVVLYEMLAGQKPFDGPPHSIIAKLATEDPPALNKIKPAIPQDLAAICQKAMEKSLSRRFENLSAMADDLDRWLSGRETLARPITRRERLVRWCQRNPLNAAMGAALAAALCIGTVVSSYFAVSANQQQQIVKQERDSAKLAEEEAKAERSRAEAEKDRAEKNEQSTRRNLYAARMNLAQQAADAGNSARVIELLESTRPASNEEDLRGFEWYHLWRLCYESQRLEVPINFASIIGLAYSPDGKTLAVGFERGGLQLRNAATGELQAKLSGHRRAVWSLVFIQNGQTLLSGSEDGTVIRWDVAKRQNVQTLKGNGGGVRSMAVSPDGKTIAAAGWEARHTKLWDADSGAERATLSGEGVGVYVAFSHNGKSLVTSGREGKLKIWDWDGVSAKERRAMTVNTRFTRFAFGSDDKSLIVTGKTPAVWDVETGKKTFTYPDFGSEAYAVAVSPDGKTIAFGNQDRNVTLWHGMERQSPVHAHRGAVHTVAFSPDGSMLATGGEDKTLRIWKVPAANEPATIRSGVVSQAVFSPDGKTLASAGYDKRVRLWDAASGTKIGELVGHAASIAVVAFSPDGKLLASAGQDSTVNLWDVAARKELATLVPETKQDICCLAFSPDGRLLAAGSRDSDLTASKHEIRLWDVSTRTTLFTLPGPHQWVTALAFAPDGQTLASGHQYGFVKLWNTSTGALIRDVQGNTGGHHHVWSLAVSPDGTMLASSSTEGAIQLWSMPSGELKQSLTGGTVEISGVRFLHDGRTLAATSRDGTLKLWDYINGLERATFKAHSREANFLDIARDDSALLTTGSDSTIKLWRTTTDSAAKALRYDVGSNDAASPTTVDHADE
jgi:WD40 repeat protein/serine/threonine protein kinase